MQKLKYALVKKKLQDLGLKIFTDNDLQQIFGASKRASQAFLSYNNRKNYLTRLKKGYYCFAGEFPHSFVIANRIYSPAYISLESALSFHQIIPETVYSVTSVTTRKTNEFKIEKKQYVYRSIKKEGFTGYKAYQLNHDRVYVATPEKALADYVYYLYLDGGKFNERMTLKRIDKEKLNHYLKLLGSHKLLNFWREK